MAILPIVKYPDPLLYEKSEKITEITPEIEIFIEDMIATMYATDGVGLAAVQAGKLLRLVVLDPTFAGGTEEDPAIVLINPEIIETEGTIKEEEGCLSLPGVFIPIERYARTKIKALNRKMEPIEMEGTEILSRAFQHEIDHLNGILIIDKVGKIRRKLALRKLTD